MVLIGVTELVRVTPHSVTKSAFGSQVDFSLEVIALKLIFRKLLEDVLKFISVSFIFPAYSKSNIIISFSTFTELPSRPRSVQNTVVS